MTLPSSGQLSLKDILDEKQGSTTARTNISLQGLSVNGTADSSGGDITGTPNGSAPYQVSEFYGYPPLVNFVWGSSTSTVPSTYFDLNGADTTTSGSQEASAGTRIDVTWFSTYMRIAYEEYVLSTTSSNGLTSQSSNINISFTGDTASIDYIQARWRIIDGNIAIDSGTNNQILALYKTNGHNVTDLNDTTTQVIRSNGQSGTNQDFTGSYVTITPSTYNGTVTQSYAIQCNSAGSNDDTRLRLTASGDSIQLEIRVVRTDGSGTTHTIQKPYVSSTNPDIHSTSFEIPDFTCIMPNMFVIAESGWKRIGDVVVGDRILAQGDLNNPDEIPIYVDVNEARTHTRSGYWNVGGIHITNDHPVWLTDETGSEWVTVDNMRDGIARTYVDGSVDPVYLGTNPGHFYVFSEDKQKVFTVSGDYAPTTD